MARGGGVDKRGTREEDPRHEAAVLRDFVTNLCYSVDG